MAMKTYNSYVSKVANTYFVPGLSIVLCYIALIQLVELYKSWNVALMMHKSFVLFNFNRLGIKISFYCKPPHIAYPYAIVTELSKLIGSFAI